MMVWILAADSQTERKRSDICQAVVKTGVIPLFLYTLQSIQRGSQSDREHSDILVSCVLMGLRNSNNI